MLSLKQFSTESINWSLDSFLGTLGRANNIVDKLLTLVVELDQMKGVGEQNQIIKKFARIFGVSLIALGVAGFMPSITVSNTLGQNILIGVIQVNVWLNALFILSGVIALLNFHNVRNSIKMFKTAALVYVGLAAFEFLSQNTSMPNVALYLSIAAVAVTVLLKTEKLKLDL